MPFRNLGKVKQLQRRRTSISLMIPASLVSQDQRAATYDFSSSSRRAGDLDRRGNHHVNRDVCKIFQKIGYLSSMLLESREENEWAVAWR